jgi:hypothetical protein
VEPATGVMTAAEAEAIDARTTRRKRARVSMGVPREGRRWPD